MVYSFINDSIGWRRSVFKASYGQHQEVYRGRLQIYAQSDWNYFGPAGSFRYTGSAESGKFPITVKKLSGHVDNSAFPSIEVNIDLTLTILAGNEGPVPVIMEFGFV